MKTEVFAWLDPNNGGVISVSAKKSLEDGNGRPGVLIASRYSVPLFRISDDSDTQDAVPGCVWPDCGHDTNGTGYSPGCTGAFCPKAIAAAPAAQEPAGRIGHVGSDKGGLREAVAAFAPTPPAGDVEALAEALYRIANNHDAHRNGLPDELHDWAAEVGRDLRGAVATARRLASAPREQMDGRWDMPEDMDWARNPEVQARFLSLPAETQMALCTLNGVIAHFAKLHPRDVREAVEHVTRAALAAAPAVVVDEAMVERACASYHFAWDIMPEESKQPLREAMGIALTAALGQGVGRD